jgi:hypothetical protein
LAGLHHILAQHQVTDIILWDKYPLLAGQAAGEAEVKESIGVSASADSKA